MSFIKYFQKKIINVALYGFMCGMSLLLSGNTLNFWLASYGIDPKIIGFFSLIIIPYVIKFLISIFISNYQIYFFSKILGHYKSWLIFSIISLSAILALMSILHPYKHLILIAFLGFLIAFFAVIQDIVLNHNRISLLNDRQQALGSAAYSVGYRLGMLFSGAGIIYMSVYLSWNKIYIILSLIYLFSAVLVIFIFQETNENKKDKTLIKMLINPFKNILKIKHFSWVCVFLITYKLSDYMLVIMLNPFLLHMQYTAAEIASISKFFGVVMALLGGVISGPIIHKIGLKRSLFCFSLFHIIGNILIVILSMKSKNISLLYLITACEALTGGMMMAAYLTFISNLCKGEYTATQYAILSSAMGLSRSLFPSISGVIVDSYSWTIFFAIICFITILTTIFISLMPKSLFEN